MYNILICDDEQDIVNALKIYLSGGDYCLFEAHNGREALEAVEKNDIHLILMDIMMPQLDGIAATAKLREKSNVPIILLTAKSESSDKVLGLNIGADDYVTKPFNPLELVARVKSQLRRYTKLGNLNTDNNAVFRAGGLVINDETKEVTVDGEPVKLTPIEFDILYLLASNPGRVFGTDEIFERVWHEKFYEANNTVMGHIRRLRGKMKDDTREDKIITTVWGVGYKIEA